MSPEVYAVVAAAGSGVRLGADLPKALVSIAGRSILERCLDGLAEAEIIDHAVVVVSSDMRDLVLGLVEEQRGAWGSMQVSVVLGGAERTESVLAGLEWIEDSCCNKRGSDTELSNILVAVHDAARCLAPPEMIAAVVDAARIGVEDGHWVGAVPVVPVTDTVKVVAVAEGGPLDGATVLCSTPPRETLRAAQTPQVFSLGALVEAYRMEEARRELDSVHPTGVATGPVVTDDASLMEVVGQIVIAVPGDRRAAKITYAEDLERAEEILERSARQS